MDRSSFVAPASVRTLILAVGHIERSTFLSAVDTLQNDAAVVSLKEILSTLVDGDDFLLSPLRFPDGSIFYNFCVSDSSEQARQLSPFELWRETLLVIGIAAGLSQDARHRETELKRAAAELHDKHGRVVHRHLLVLAKHGTAGDADQQRLDVTTLSDISKESIVPAIHTITMRFLREFATYATAMQASPSIQTPGHVSQGMLRAMMLREEETRPASRHGTPVEPRSPPSEDGSSRPASQDIIAPPATTFDQIPAANSLGRSDSNTSHRSKSRPRTTSFDRVPTHALSKEKLKDRGKARVGIVTGSIYLMSGQWAEALKLLVECTTRLRTLNDHIWNAKGLELIAVCLVLYVWAKVDVQVPAIIFQLSDKVRDRLSKAFAADLAQKLTAPQTAVERLSSALHDLLRHILLLYHSVEGTMELPYIAVAEATVRFCKALAALLNTNGVFNEQSIATVVDRAAPFHAGYWSACTFMSNKPLTKNGVSNMLAKALPLSDDSVPLSDHICILTGAASVYAMLKLDRKKAIILKTLITRLIAALNQARKLGAAEVGIHPSAILSVDTEAQTLLDTGPDSIGLAELAQNLASVYGAPMQGCSTAYPSGSTTLQLDILRDLLRLCETAPDLKGISQLVVAFLVSAEQPQAVDLTSKARATTVTIDEQTQLLNMLSRTSWLKHQLGLSGAEVPYWDPYMLRGIEVKPSSTERAITELAKTSPGSLPSSNPLLYDPNAPATKLQSRKIILAKDETARVCLTLQNPLDVALDIEHIQLVTDGADLAGTSTAVRLQPACLQRILLDIQPADIGNATLVGARIKVVGCAAQMSYLTTQPYRSRLPTVLKMIGQPLLREMDTKSDSSVVRETVSIDVIEAQPQLLIVHNTEYQGRLLIEGEEQTHDLIVKNVSSQQATLLSMNSLTDNIRTDYSPVQPLVLKPGAEHKQKFTMLGIPMLSIAQLRVIYTTSAESSFAKSCSLSVKLSVLPSLHVVVLDVLDVGQGRVEVVLDLFNRWTKPISAALTYGSDAIAQSKAILMSGETRRMGLTILRSALPASQAEFLQGLRLRWSSDQRSGHVALDHIQLSEASIEVLRTTAVNIHLSLLETAQPEVRLGEFMVIRAAIKNNRAIPVGPGVLRLQHCIPREVSPVAQTMPTAGAMSCILSSLSPGEQRTVDFALCPLLAGSLTLDAILRPALPSATTVIDSTTTHRLEVRVV